MAANSELKLKVALDDQLSGGLKKLGGLMASVFAIDQLKNFAQESIKAASEQQIAESKLAALLGNVKTARAGDLQMLKEQATALQNVTAVSDEQIINAQAMLATNQLNGEQIKKLIPGILDMAAANAGLGDAQGDVTAAAVAMGKSFTMGAGVLSRYNLTMSDAEKKAFDLADKTEKLNILTKALQENFGGAAAAAAETYEGRMKRVSNQVGEIKEKIGNALIPTIDFLSQQFLGSVDAINGNENAFKTFGEIVFRVVNILVLAGKTVYMLITMFTRFGDGLVDAAKVAFGFGKDVVNVFQTVKQGVGNVVKGIALALKGDFKEAWDTMKSTSFQGFTNFKSNLDSMKNHQQGWGELMKDQFASMGDSWNAVVDLKGYKPMQAATQKMAKSVGQNLKEVSKGAQEHADTMKKLGDTYKETMEKGADALADLADEHAQKMKSIRDEITKTQQSITDLNKDFEKQKADDTKGIAEKIVAGQQRMADIQKELAGDVTDDRREELKKELLSIQQTYTKYADFIKSIDTQVTEAKRVAGLNDIERAIEEYNSKTAIATQEYNEKLQRLQDEVTASQMKEQEEVNLYNQKVQKIQQMMDAAAANYKNMLQNNLNMTTQAINAEIDMYNQLAKAIANVRGGSAAQVARVNPTTLLGGTQTNNVNVNVNASVSSNVDITKLATQVSSTIMSQLQTNTKI